MATEIKAKCGRSDVHGGHVYPRENGTKSGFCVGNRGPVVVEVRSPFTLRALAGQLPASDRTGAAR